MQEITPQSLLRKVQNTLIIDLLHHVYRLPDELLYVYPKEPMDGIYMRSSFKPILKDGVKYYLASNYHNPKLYIKDFNDVLIAKQDILNEDGDVVLSALEIMRYHKLLSTAPTIPVTVVDIAFCIVKDLLVKIAPYARCSKLNRYDDLLKDDYSYVADDCLYEDELSDLTVRIREFIGEDTWHIYYAKLMGTTLIVEKIIDYRIYHYHEQLWLKKQDEDPDG